MAEEQQMLPGWGSRPLYIAALGQKVGQAADYDRAGSLACVIHIDSVDETARV